jgi:hypothetical protein
VPYHPTASDWQPLRQFHVSCPEGLIYRAKTLSSEALQTATTQEPVCSTCKGTGYHGRLGVYELLVLDRNLKGLILEGASVDQLRDAACTGGMKTLTEYALQLVAQGMTTLEEVERVVLSSLAEIASADEGASARSPLVKPVKAMAVVEDSGSPNMSPDDHSQELLALIQNILKHPDIPIKPRQRWSSQVLNIMQHPDHLSGSPLKIVN